jgi:hypothetical protein
MFLVVAVPSMIVKFKCHIEGFAAELAEKYGAAVMSEKSYAAAMLKVYSKSSSPAFEPYCAAEGLA